MDARQLLLGQAAIEQALGPRLRVVAGTEPSPVQAMGAVAARAAQDVAYRSFTGKVQLEDTTSPVAVGEMALVFDDPGKAGRTFRQVGEAAHLRLRLGATSVAVETVTAPSGLVSYWAFLNHESAIVILTLDTVHPHDVSMTDFRNLVTLAAKRIEGRET